MPALSRMMPFFIPVALLLSAALQVLVPAEADKGWLLHVAHMALEGKRLYREIIEVNPPLIIWFYEIPVWISMHMPVRDFEALGAIGVLTSLITCFVAMRIIRHHPAFECNVNLQISCGKLLALIFIFFTTQIYFFDRDHIFFVLTFPYLLRLMPSLYEKKFSAGLKLLIGVMAAIGFCMKPHTIVIFAAIQLICAARLHSAAMLWKVENLIIGAGALLYFACIWHFAPEYVHIVMPMSWETYLSFGHKNSGWFYLPPVVVGLGLIFVDFRAWYKTPFRPDVYYFMALCAAFLAYALANAGWGYTYNPLYCIMIFTTGWMMWEYTWLKEDHLRRRVDARRFMYGIRGCMMVFTMQAMYILAYVAIAHFSLGQIRHPCVGKQHCESKGPYADYMLKHDLHAFGTISLDFSNWVGLLNSTGTRWETRFNHLWMMPQYILEPKEEKIRHEWVLDFVGKAFAEDLERYKIPVIFLDSSPGFMGKKPAVNIATVLGAVPEFKQAWSHYRYDVTLGKCPDKLAGDVIPSGCLYDAYRRVDDSAGDSTKR